MNMGKAVLATLAALAFLALAPAARGQDSSPPLVLPHRSSLFTPPSTRPTLQSTLTIPAETEVSVQLLSGIHTRVSHVDDFVQALLLKPVYVGGRVALPLGTLIDGRITRIQPARRLHRPAELAFRFDRVMLPDGQAEPISAIITGLDNPKGLNLRLDTEGHLKGTRGLSWKDFLGGVAGFGFLGGVKAAAASSTAVNAMLPAGAVALVGYEIFWPRGNDVNLPPDTPCLIRLNSPVTVQVIG
jgi:hypothetical protein